jgi:L-asparaginase II
VVAGEGRFCTDLVRATGAELAAKTGAEGLECIAIPALGTGVVAKVEDGSERPKAPALLDFLLVNELISPEAFEKLGRWSRPILKNHRDKSVGEIQLVPQRHPANSS